MSDEEQWKDVVGYEGKYRVSNWGRIQNSSSGRYLNGSPNAAGHVVVRLVTERGNGRMYYLHRLVCAAFHGPAPSPDLVVCHANGKSLDCRADNLCWVTRSEATVHAAKFRRLRRPASARLTDEAVVEMRRRSRAGDTYTRLASAFGVSVSAAYRAVVGRTWRHVRDDAVSAHRGSRAGSGAIGRRAEK